LGTRGPAMQKLFLLVINLLIGFNSSATLATKAFYHRGHCTDQLVFYFDKLPKVTSRSVAGAKEYVIELQGLSADVKGALSQMHSFGDGYHMQIHFKAPSLVIKIEYDRQKIALVSASKFVPISQPHAIVIKIERHGKSANKECLRPSSKRTVVLDFGHGGKDSGTKIGDLAEKDIVREVGSKLAKMLKNDGYNIHLTRTADQYAALDERTYLANLKTDAAIFISLHANYSANPLSEGIETFYLHHGLLDSIDSHHNLAKLEHLNAQNFKLAQHIHHSLLSSASKSGLVDRKIKRSVSQILLGTEMPAVLIELGFLSSPKEARLLSSPNYQALLADGIRRGINAWFAA